MKQPHMNSTPVTKSRESNSVAATQHTGESDRVSHGLRILGQLTIQNANREASKIGLTDHELEELFRPMPEEQIAANAHSKVGNSSNLLLANEKLAADNIRAMNSIDALLSHRAEQIVLPTYNVLHSTTYDCLIQSRNSENASVMNDLAQTVSQTQAIHIEPSFKYLRHDQAHADSEQEKPTSVVSNDGNSTAPQAETDNFNYHPEVRRVVDHLAKQLVKGKSRIWQFHALTAPAHEEAVTQIWPLALCWAKVRSESLLVIDATQHGHSLASTWGWQDDVGLQDILFDEKIPSAALRKTHFDKLTFLSRGVMRAADSADWSSGAEHQLRLKSLLTALQRDYAAIWVVTSGDWNAFSQTISESAHKRELVIPMTASNTAQVWRTSVNKLIQQNVLINGWLALGSSETKQLSA